MVNYIEKYTKKWPSNLSVNYFISNVICFFSNIYNVLIILATLTVTIAIAERSFSTLRKLKTYLRNNKW